MKLQLTFFLLICLIFSANSQDTLRYYFNDDWKIVKSNSKNISLERIVTPTDDNSLKTIIDYDKKGQLIQIAHSSAPVKDLLSKKFKLDGWQLKYTDEGQLKFRKYFNNGQLLSETFLYKNGSVEDSTTWNNTDGNKYKNLICYHENGNIERIEKYINNKLTDSICFDSTGIACEYIPYFEPPSFPGGKSALNKYLASVKYPIEAMQKGIHGRVFITFIIDEDGNPADVKIVKGVHRILDNAALNHLKKMPKWNPAKKKGKSTQTDYITLPINFVYLGVFQK